MDAKGKPLIKRNGIHGSANDRLLFLNQAYLCLFPNQLTKRSGDIGDACAPANGRGFVLEALEARGGLEKKGNRRMRGHKSPFIHTRE